MVSNDSLIFYTSLGWNYTFAEGKRKFLFKFSSFRDGILSLPEVLAVLFQGVRKPGAVNGHVCCLLLGSEVGQALLRHENTVRLRDFTYIDQVTQDYGTGQLWRSSLLMPSLGALVLALFS